MSEEILDKNNETNEGPNESREDYYSSSDNNKFEGRRPYNSNYGPRPRYESSYQEGKDRYSRPGGYGDRRQGGYRSGYMQRRMDGEEGYQAGPKYQNRGGRPGFQPREYRSDNRFNKRPSYGYNNEYRADRYEEGGNRPYYDKGRYGSKDGYQPRRNGYGPRPERPNRGGYNNGYGRRDGYDPHAKYSMKKRLEYKEEHYDPTVPVRLNKFLSNAGICSRRDADKYIQAGVVSVNGEVVKELGAKVLRTDLVKFHDTPVKMEKKVYVLLNKPKGYVTTSEDPQNRKTVMDLVKDACRERIYPVGRLDRNTTGVLLLTNDGELASKLTHPQYLKKKIYHVYCDKNVAAEDIQKIADGITLDDGEIKADEIEYASPTDKKQVGIEIHSGRNRIVRRIFESLGYHVIKLDRVYFAGLTKKNVRRGDWRYLTEKEVDMLRMGAFE